VSELNKKVYARVEEWRNRRLDGEYPYVYVDGIYLKRSWGGEMVSVSVLVAIGVSQDGYREVLGAMEGSKEDKACWKSFLVSLKERGLKETDLFISDRSLGFVESIGDVFPESFWQRCLVHFYRNMFCVIPSSKMRECMAMLKAIHAQEDLSAAKSKAVEIAKKMNEMKLKEASERLLSGIEETLSYMKFPREHWTRIRTNNTLERLNREIRRRTRVVGCFPDGRSALMLVCARLRYVAAQEWGSKRYLNMNHLKDMKTIQTVVVLTRNLDKNGKANKVYITKQGMTLWQKKTNREERNVAA